MVRVHRVDVGHDLGHSVATLGSRAISRQPAPRPTRQVPTPNRHSRMYDCRAGRPGLRAAVVEVGHRGQDAGSPQRQRGPGPDRPVAAVLRPQMAARRRRRRDRRHRAHRAEGPRLCGDRRRAAPERPVRGRGGRDHLRALLHLAPDLDRAELLAGRRRGRCRRRRRPRRRAGRRARRRDRADHRAAVPRARAPAAGMDLALPLEGGHHGLPRGRRRRRRHRRASQADRDRRGGRDRVARARRRGSARSEMCTGRPSSSACSPWR